MYVSLRPISWTKYIESKRAEVLRGFLKIVRAAMTVLLCLIPAISANGYRCSQMREEYKVRLRIHVP